MKKNLLFAIVFSISLLFVACSNDDKKDEPIPDSTPTTTAEDRVNIQNAFDQLDVNFNQFKTGVSFTEVDSFISRADNDLLTQDWLDSMGTKLDRIANFDQINANDRFQYSSFIGKYVWSNTSETWTKSANSSILLQFPSERTMVTNDCEFAVTNYSDSPYTIDTRLIYLPTVANAYFKKDGVKYLGVDLTAIYNAQGFPINANIGLYAKPLTISGSLLKETDSRYKITGSLVNEVNVANQLSVSATITFDNTITAYSDFNDAVLNNVRVTLTQGSLKVDGTLDVKTLDQLQSAPGEPSVTDINNTMNFSVYYNEVKVGTLKVVEVSGVREIYIVYKDATQENTSLFYDSFINNLETLFQ